MTRENNEMTDKIFKFQNIQLQPSDTQATGQNKILLTEGTAEEQFALIQASSRQHTLNDIQVHEQPTVPDKYTTSLHHPLRNRHHRYKQTLW